METFIIISLEINRNRIHGHAYLKIFGNVLKYIQKCYHNSNFQCNTSTSLHTLPALVLYFKETELNISLKFVENENKE